MPRHTCGHSLLTRRAARVQQDTLRRRAHRNDPLYRARRLLRRRADRLTDQAWTRLTTQLTDGDPNGEVTAAWALAQDIMPAYAADDATTGRARTEQAITAALTCPVPELTRLGRTLRARRNELLAYFSTEPATSNGPTEAINLLIETSRRADHGFRNFDNYRLRLLLTTPPRLAIMPPHGSEGPIPQVRDVEPSCDQQGDYVHET